MCVQVKTIDSEQRRSWPLPSRREKIIDGIMFVCVILNGIDEEPTYYILPPQEVRERGKWYATLPVLNIGAILDGNFLGAWHLIDTQINGSPIPPSIVEKGTRVAPENPGLAPSVVPKQSARRPSERGTKTIDLCGRPQGATGKELREATGAPPTTPWKYDIEGLARRYGYVLRVTRRDGVSCYHLESAPLCAP